MQMTQKDYDERKARVNDGVATDEDLRLVKQYEAEGFREQGDPGSTTRATADKSGADKSSDKAVQAKSDAVQSDGSQPRGDTAAFRGEATADVKSPSRRSAGQNR